MRKEFDATIGQKRPSTCHNCPLAGYERITENASPYLLVALNERTLCVRSCIFRNRYVHVVDESGKPTNVEAGRGYGIHADDAVVLGRSMNV